MAFLRLNGWTIPILAESATESPIDIGETIRSYDGTYLSNRRARKRTWSLETPIQKETVAKAIESLVAGLGQSWPFNFSDTARLTQDLFSSKGAGPGSTIGGMRFGIGADGASVVDDTDVAESQFGSGALAVEPSTTNILAANQRDLEDATTTGFTAIAGGVIANVTTHKVQGSRSLSVTATGAGQGVETTGVTAAAFTDYTASVYFKSATTDAWVFAIMDGATTLATVTESSVANKWKRVAVTGTIGASPGSVKLRITKSAAGTAIIFCDAFQIEAPGVTLVNIASTWADPSRTNGNLEYSTGLISSFQDLTINFWMKRFADDPGPLWIFLLKTATVGEIIEITSDPGTDSLNFNVQTVALASSINSGASSVPLNTWKMVTAVIHRNPESGENRQELYLNGSLVASANPATTALLNFADVTKFAIGHDGDGADHDQSLQDDLAIYPFAAPASLISAWFSYGRSVANTPRLELDGDIIPEDRAIVEGRVSNMPHQMASIGDVFRNNARGIEFDLEEV